MRLCTWRASNVRGATSIEYALLIALIAVATVPAMSQISNRASATLLRAVEQPQYWQLNGGGQAQNGTNDSLSTGGGTWGSIKSTIPNDGSNMQAFGGDPTRSGQQGNGGSPSAATGDDSSNLGSGNQNTKTTRR